MGVGHLGAFEGSGGDGGVPGSVLRDMPGGTTGRQPPLILDLSQVSIWGGNLGGEFQISKEGAETREFRNLCRRKNPRPGKKHTTPSLSRASISGENIIKQIFPG